MNKIKNFFRLVGLEFVRLFRNKAVITLLLVFACVITIFVSFSIRLGDMCKSFDISIYTNGKELSEISAMEIIDERFDREKFIFVDSIEEGVDLLKENKVVFFLEIDTKTSPETIVLHYDGFSNASMMLKETLNNQKNEYSYNTITEMLDKYGITINRSYFESLRFESINDSNGWERSTLYVYGVSAGISVILMFGLAYSISRDSETSANKIVAFMPISVSKFMWSKMLTYILIGILEMFILLILGIAFFNIKFQMNWLLIILFSSIFILATILLGIIFSSYKSQVVTVLCSVAFILIPLIMLSNNVIQGIIFPIKMLLYVMPMTPFIYLFHGMVFNGVIDWLSIFILLLQIIFYYLFAYLLLRKNVKNN